VLEGLPKPIVGLTKGFRKNFLTPPETYRVHPGRVFLSAVPNRCWGLFPNRIWIFTARTGDRLGKGIRTSARDALLADESLAKDRGKVSIPSSDGLR